MVTAVVLAGGAGTRIRHLHPDLPKPMIPVAGRPFVEWVIAHLASQGIARVVVSAGYRADVIERWATAARIPGVAVSAVRENVPLGTAGAFLWAARSLDVRPDEVLVVANGDSVVLADLGPFLALAREAACDAVVLGVDVDDASRFGSLEVDSQGDLRAFREKRPGRGLVNAGIYAFRGETLASFPGGSPLSFEVDVFPRFLSEGKRVRVARTRAPFIDIGVPESLAGAEEFVRRYITPAS